MLGVPDDTAAAPEPGRRAPVMPSEGIMASVLWGTLQQAAKAHSRAVEAAKEAPEENVPAWMVDDVLTKGAILDNSIYKALEWFTVEQIISGVTDLHPRYVAELERSASSPF
jgi:hypothetical protein